MNEPIVELYKDVLDAADLSADSDGMVSLATPGSKGSSLTISGKRLVLPTHAHLTNPDWSGRVGFHPFVENIIGGESQVHERFRRCANSAINLRVSYIFLAMVDLCQDKSKEKQQTLPPECSQLMMALANGDDQLYVRVKKILDKAPVFVHTNVQKGADIDGKKYRVGCVTYFPIYDELVKGTKEIEGVNLRQRDVEVLKHIYQFIFPNIGKKHYYSAGSDSLFSPTIIAELTALEKIYACLNTILTTYEAALKGAIFIKPTTWTDKIEKLPEMKKMIDAIPMLDGNAGKVKKSGAPVGTSIAIPDAQTVQMPVHTRQVTGVSPGSPVQMSQLPQASQQPAIHAPVQQSAVHAPIAHPGQQLVHSNHQTTTSTPMTQTTFKKIGQTSTDKPGTGLSVQQPTHESMYGPSVPVQAPPPAVYATPMGYMPAQQLSLSQAQRMQDEQMKLQQAQQQAQMQQVQKQREQQILVQAAQAAGIQVMMMNNGVYGGAMMDASGAMTWQPLSVQNVPNAMQYFNMNGIVPSSMMASPGAPVAPLMQQMPQLPANPAPMTPGGSVDFATMMANNPALQSVYMSDQIQQQQLQMQQMQMQQMQMYGGMPGMHLQPGMQMPQQMGYVPGYMRAMQLPAGAVAPVGRLQ